MAHHLTIDTYTNDKVTDVRIHTVKDRDDASARLYRTLSAPEFGSSFRARAMARFGDGESDFKVIEPNQVYHIYYEEE
jgi:hypothetical protein